MTPQTETVGLLPCPFCGKKPRHSQFKTFLTVRCPTPHCPSSEGIQDTKEAAIAAWNRRTPTPDLTPGDGAEARHTAYEWNEILNFQILDYDGFRDGTITTETKMSETEFRRRAQHATRMLVRPLAPPTHVAGDGEVELLARRIVQWILDCYEKHQDTPIPQLPTPEQRIADLKLLLAQHRTARLTALEAERDGLKVAVEKAPHEPSCRHLHVYKIEDGAIVFIGECNCWKSTALAGHGEAGV